MSNLSSSAADATMELAVRTRTLVADLAERAQARLAEERGQTAAEYMGILMIVAVIIAGIFSLGLDTQFKNLVQGFIDNISSGTKPSGGAAPAGGGG